MTVQPTTPAFRRSKVSASRQPSDLPGRTRTRMTEAKGERLMLVEQPLTGAVRDIAAAGPHRLADDDGTILGWAVYRLDRDGEHIGWIWETWQGQPGWSNTTFCAEYYDPWQQDWFHAVQLTPGVPARLQDAARDVVHAVLNMEWLVKRQADRDREIADVRSALDATCREYDRRRRYNTVTVETREADAAAEAALTTPMREWLDAVERDETPGPAREFLATRGVRLGDGD